jgi:hypothetical protein
MLTCTHAKQAIRSTCRCIHTSPRSPYGSCASHAGRSCLVRTDERSDSFVHFNRGIIMHHGTSTAATDVSPGMKHWARRVCHHQSHNTPRCSPARKRNELVLRETLQVLPSQDRQTHKSDHHAMISARYSVAHRLRESVISASVSSS